MVETLEKLEIIANNKKMTINENLLIVPIFK